MGMENTKSSIKRKIAVYLYIYNDETFFCDFLFCDITIKQCKFLSLTYSHLAIVL